MSIIIFTNKFLYVLMLNKVLNQRKEMFIKMGIGERIKKILDSKRMTVSELADTVEMPRTSLYSIIKRDSEYMNLNNLYKIANALGVTIYDLQGVPWMNEVAKQNRSDKDKTQTLLNHYNKLNSLGQEKAIERVKELTEIEKYTDPDEQ